MAFMGMVFAGAALLLAAGIALADLAMLIIATVLVCTRHRTAAAVLYGIAAIPIVGTAVAAAGFAHSLRYPKYETYDGSFVTVDMRDVDRMKECIAQRDLDGLDRLLDDAPELIYYLDTNHMSLLEFGLRNCDVPVMQIAVDHGARFDDEVAHRHLVFKHSLEEFFDLDYWVFAYTFDTKPEPRFTAGAATPEMVDAARFAIEHGASVRWEKYGEEWTFADQVSSWIDADGVISAQDEALLALADEALQ
ncbi:MAG: hypothetical protein IJ055_05780 [Oscillospiraceae bacterium]|nr:hypothetical protein [Oscillospiraceae bacterium]